MARIPDNYIPVTARIADFVRRGGQVMTEVTQATDTYAIIKAVVSYKPISLSIDGINQDEGGMMATGHALVSFVEYEDKGLEKAETVAIGRALTNMGISALGDEEFEDKPAPKKTKGVDFGKRLKKSEPKADKEVEEVVEPEMVETEEETTSKAQSILNKYRKK